MDLLNTGAVFPSLTVNVVGGDTLNIPEALAGSFGVVLFYRGSWCPYCTAQLRAFQRANDRFAQMGIKVVALSVDDEATTKDLVDKHKLTFPVGHSTDARAVAEATGAFVNDEPVHLQSTGFVLAPDGTVITAVYSTGAIGRLVPEDVLGLVSYIKEHRG
ncbi:MULTISPECIES: peroxiredoxin family protein [unclassified Streptomyces]|uniref:peroxiredoxin family protein n=1 Tax=unclassified Streptomyces TaxID=2593676 RepID=UPI0004C91411|nr:MULTISPECIES: peroxiredoxin family protein [unclassified Streptomyces]KOV71354.1 peroxiredoxin [Streptomyces sp. NRRL WC-3723]